MSYRENVVEKRLYDQVKTHDGKCYKFLSGIRGVPDRIVVLNGHTVFVELKAPGRKPDPLQKVRIKEIRDRGGVVHVIDTVEGVDAFIAEVTQPNPNYRTVKE